MLDIHGGVSKSTEPEIKAWAISHAHSSRLLIERAELLFNLRECRPELSYFKRLYLLSEPLEIKRERFELVPLSIGDLGPVKIVVRSSEKGQKFLDVSELLL